MSASEDLEMGEDAIDPVVVEYIQDELSVIQNKYKDAVEQLEENRIHETQKLLNEMLDRCNNLTAYATSIPNERLVEVSEILEHTAKKFASFMTYDKARCCCELGRIYLRALSTEAEFVTHAMLYLSITKHFVRLLLFGNNSDGAMIALRADAELFENSTLKKKYSLSLAQLLHELGYYLSEHGHYVNATGPLEQGLKLMQDKPQNVNGASLKLKAKLLSTLGSCHFYVKHAEAKVMLTNALETWKTFPWQAEDIRHVVDTIYYIIELQNQNQEAQESESEGSNLHEDLYAIHHSLTEANLGSPVPEALTHLGVLSFQSNQQSVACSYFEKALALFRQSCNNTDPIFMSKLLRYIGITNYNQHKFQKAAPAYHECLKILLELENKCEKCEQPLGKNNIADCYASLGFTYSRLRNFDNMLKYYEMALKLRNYLSQEDLELIDTNIGSLYHVKAAKFEKAGRKEEAAEFHKLAEEAFVRALGYSWKSFPYINYGYYLLCRERYDDAMSNLHQGYSNGVIDKDTVEFDHTEDVILISDLQFELCYREDIRMPSKIIALYLKAIAEVKADRTEIADYTVSKLQKESNSCKYENYYTEGFGLENMKALCYSLVGYAYKTLGKLPQAKEAFQDALILVPDYNAAKQNVKLLTEQGVL